MLQRCEDELMANVRQLDAQPMPSPENGELWAHFQEQRDCMARLVAEVQGPVQQRRRPEVVVRLPEVDVAQRFDASHISCIDEAAQRLGDDDVARMSACSGGGLQFVEGEGWER